MGGGGDEITLYRVHVHTERGRDGIILNKRWGVVRADIVTEFRRRFSDAPQAAYRFGARNPGEEEEETKDDPRGKGLARRGERRGWRKKLDRLKGYVYIYICMYV